MSDITLFEAVGGADGVLRLAAAWHERVMQDDVVSHAFSHGFHPAHTERLAAYWGEAWGGPPDYSGRYGTESSVVRMHSGHGQHEEMDQRAIECFHRALEDAGIADARLRDALGAYFAWATRTSMAAYPERESIVPDHLRLPKWSWNGLLQAAAIPPHALGMWRAYVATAGGADEARFYEAFCFGDSQELADDLAALVVQGTKRATAGAVWSFAAEGKRMPRPGDLSVVTNWSGQPQCIIETLSVDVVPFAEVTAEFAATEGEGDGSLSYWQHSHRAYFTRECQRAGREFSERMPIACERFKVVYQPASGAPT